MLNASLTRAGDAELAICIIDRERHPMCRNLALLATALIAVALAPLARAADAGATAASPTAAQGATSSATTAKPAPPRKASPAERVAADRMEPLARAAFWGHEIDLDPTDVVAGTHLASALRALGQYDAAADSAQRALVVDPSNYDALLEAARDYIAKGDGFYAVDPAQRAEKLQPKDWRPLSLLGVAYTQVRRDDDAQAAWKAALGLSPDNPAVLSNMAMALASKGDAAGAEVLLRRAVAQPGASLQVRQDLTLVLGVEGKLGEAEKLLREDLPPEQADANLAYFKAVSTGKDPVAVGAGAEARTWNSLKGAGS
jgi:Flp pilus assembly protein TadD